MINLTKNDGFFTLMEVITALAIFSVLVAAAIPGFSMQMEKARAGEAVQMLEYLYKSQQAYYSEYKAYTNTAANLDINLHLPSYFNAPTFGTTDPIVSIQRSTGAYTLRITSAGAISCIPSGGTCGSLGY